MSTVVVIHSVPRTADKSLVGRLGVVVGTEGRKKVVLLADGQRVVVSSARLVAADLHGPPPPDPFEAAAFRWRRLWKPVGQVDRLLEAPTAADLRAEVAAAAEDFGDAQFTWGEGEATLRLALTTEPVVLGGLSLGRFRVVIEVRLGGEPWATLTATALEPNRSKADPRLTHPHVRGEYVCLGDGESDFQVAARSGRLFDAALVVWSVLSHYSYEFCFEGGRSGPPETDGRCMPCHREWIVNPEALTC